MKQVIMQAKTRMVMELKEKKKKKKEEHSN